MLINDILDLSKIESGKFQFEKIGFKVREVVKHILTTKKLHSDEKGIVLDLEKKIQLLQPKWYDKKAIWFGFGFLSTLGTGILINSFTN